MKIEIRSPSQAKVGASTFLLIPAAGDSYLNKLGLLSEQFNFLELDYDLRDPSQVLDYALKTIELLEEKKIKSLSLIGWQEGGALAQAISVRTWRILRRLVLLDSFTRLSPTWFEQLVDRIESYLPLGLPLRNTTNAYDSRPELHRIHCPTLVLRSLDSDMHLDFQAQLLNKYIPNSWLKKLTEPAMASNQLSQELSKLISDFEQVPAKRSQK